MICSSYLFNDGISTHKILIYQSPYSHTWEDDLMGHRTIEKITVLRQRNGLSEKVRMLKTFKFNNNKCERDR